ncbi:MAG TPA: BatD family protein, partial [Chitinophagaceae bacterium]|nr:BatD family protein [Chitinophagaceae bacterium]
MLPFLGKGQVVFKTIAPQQPIVAGESFRIQFVIEQAESIHNFTPPSFEGFRMVNGPLIYSGLKNASLTPLKNTVYTLQAIEPGRYFLQGAVAMINGKKWRSNDVMIEVKRTNPLNKSENWFDAGEENTSYLKPGEDPYEKIRRNLFVKVLMNKKTCFTGEPLVATFKLYSRLQSKSDVIKNPGFYGFSVYDMINLDDKLVNTEIVNGKEFYVHTIRKVQLYPLQAGDYTIDPMEILNKVEFSKSMVRKKPEQEIVEGVFEEEEVIARPGTEIFESNTKTSPVSVKVIAYPEKNKPAVFGGATGRFKISATLEKNELGREEEGYLKIRINGKGNFTQLVAPAIQWPPGIEAFEATVMDSLDKLSSPLKGSRTFRYAFVANKPGNYEIPTASFSFFDPDSNRYREIITEALHLVVTDRIKQKPKAFETKVPIYVINNKVSQLAAGFVVLLVLIACLYWIFLRSKLEQGSIKNEGAKAPIPTLEATLRTSYLMVP